MKQSKIYTKEILEEAIKHCINFSQVCRYLGKHPKGGTFEVIRNKIIYFGLDISHFKGQSSHTGYNHSGRNKRKYPHEIFVGGKHFRERAWLLRRCLLEIGVEYKCSVCGISKWNNMGITLEVDHIDGDWRNCEKENLRFMCPNCHSQTETYSGKNKKGDFV
jgi:hypothetical protein